MSRRGSAEGGSGGGSSEVVVLKRRRLVAAAPLHAGLARLALLLDATQPGALPDALFMSALLDLVSCDGTKIPMLSNALLLRKRQCIYYESIVRGLAHTIL